MQSIETKKSNPAEIFLTKMVKTIDFSNNWRFPQLNKLPVDVLECFKWKQENFQIQWELNGFWFQSKLCLIDVFLSWERDKCLQSWLNDWDLILQLSTSIWEPIHFNITNWNRIQNDPIKRRQMSWEALLRNILY